jgi:hypothetical protein
MPGDPAAKRDLLLATVRVVLSVVMAAALFVVGSSIVASLLAQLWQVPILAHLSQSAGRALPPSMSNAISGVFALIALSTALGFLFIRNLRRIVDTVAEGDPFIPENAVRLERMAWLVLTIELVAIPSGALAGWIAYVGHVRYLDVGVSIGALILALILFVLARVFRRGAEMRDELEGTV